MLHAFDGRTTQSHHTCAAAGGCGSSLRLAPNVRLELRTYASACSMRRAGCARRMEFLRPARRIAARYCRRAAAQRRMDSLLRRARLQCPDLQDRSQPLSRMLSVAKLATGRTRSRFFGRRDLSRLADMRGSWAVSFGMPSKSPDVWRADVEATRKALPRNKVLSVSVVATPEPHWTLDELASDFAQCARWASRAARIAWRQTSPVRTWPAPTRNCINNPRLRKLSPWRSVRHRFKTAAHQNRPRARPQIGRRAV